MRFRGRSRAGTPRARSRRVWRRARAGARKCRSSCPRDARGSPHNPWREGRNRWPETRWACHPQPRARRAARARCPPPGTRRPCAPHARDSFFVAFEIRRLDVIERKVAAFLIPEFGHAPAEVVIERGVAGLHADKADAQHRRLLRARADERDDLAAPHAEHGASRIVCTARDEHAPTTARGWFAAPLGYRSVPSRSWGQT